MAFLNINIIRRYWKTLGPGLVTGAADDDPSGIATYSQAGAQYGLQLIWLSVFTFPLSAVIQEMCARIGMVSGMGLAENIRRKYPKHLLYICVGLLFAANTFNIGADLGAIAASVQLLAPSFNFVITIIAFTLLSVWLQIVTSYKVYSQYLKYLALVLLSYVATGLLIGFDWGQVLAHVVMPSMSFSKEGIFIVCGILGTTISPYLFFWQPSQEVEEEIGMGRVTLKSRKGATDTEIRDMRVDVWSGMFVSNLVMFFIIGVCATALFDNGIISINTAAEAAVALRPLAGGWASVIFALGVIGTGLLAIPVLAGSSAYAIAETFHWHEGLYKKFRAAYGFYLTIAVSMIIALALNFSGIDPIKALIYSAVANGIVAPIVLFFVVHLSSDKSVMGDRINSRVASIIGWLIIIIMAMAGLAAIISLMV